MTTPVDEYRLPHHLVKLNGINMIICVVVIFNICYTKRYDILCANILFVIDRFEPSNSTLEFIPT